MITLYTFGRLFKGLPDPSPFVIKVELLLRMAELEYDTNKKGLNKAPKSKLPYIKDDGVVIADSALIRLHIEKKYGIDFNQGVSVERAAVLWAAERMCEEHLYFGILYDRWINERNFKAGPVHFFNSIPALTRPIVVNIVRKSIKKSLHGQGMGRHTEDEVHHLCLPDIVALATLLGDAPFFGGEQPCGADATLAGFVMGLLCPVFDTPLRDETEKHANLLAYRDRMMARFYGDFHP